MNAWPMIKKCWGNGMDDIKIEGEAVISGEMIFGEPRRVPLWTVQYWDEKFGPDPIEWDLICLKDG